MAFAVTVDLVVLTIRDDELCVLAVRRGVAAVSRALGASRRVRPDGRGTSRCGARRELAEETGLDDVTRPPRAARDVRRPRPRSADACGQRGLPRARRRPAGARRPAADAAEARWRPVADLLLSPGRLAFDHERILRDGVERARAKLEYSPLATAFCADEFTVAELRRVYEVVWGTELDPRNFHRKVTGSPGFLEPTGRRHDPERRPAGAALRRGAATVLYPPISR